MKEPTFTEYFDSLKSVTGLLVGVGVLVPAVSYFTLFTPPMLEASSLFTAAIAVATIVAVFHYRFRAGDVKAARGLPRLVRRALQMLSVATFTFLCYLLLLRFTTVVDPRGESRFQVGFHKAKWSLTEVGRAKPVDMTLQDWMLSGAYFREGGPEVLWTSASIYAAGALGIALFTTTFILWTAGWALLAKQHAYTRGRMGPLPDLRHDADGGMPEPA